MVSAGIECWTSGARAVVVVEIGPGNMAAGAAPVARAGVVGITVAVVGPVGVGLWAVVDEVDVDSLAVIFRADWRDRGDGFFGFVPKLTSHA